MSSDEEAPEPRDFEEEPDEEPLSKAEVNVEVEKVLFEDKLKINNLIQMIVSFIYAVIFFFVPLAYSVFLLVMFVQPIHLADPNVWLLKILSVCYTILILVAVIVVMIVPFVICFGMSKKQLTAYYVLQIVVGSLVFFMGISSIVSCLSTYLGLFVQINAEQIIFCVLMTLATILMLAISVVLILVIARAIWLKYQFEKKNGAQLTNLGV